MTFIHVFERDVAAVREALQAHHLEQVRIAPAFLGRVVVQCPDKESAAVVAAAVETSLAA